MHVLWGPSDASSVHVLECKTIRMATNIHVLDAADLAALLPCRHGANKCALPITTAYRDAELAWRQRTCFMQCEQEWTQGRDKAKLEYKAPGIVLDTLAT
jgi:hypothetical protein